MTAPIFPHDCRDCGEPGTEQIDGGWYCSGCAADIRWLAEPLTPEEERAVVEAEAEYVAGRR